MSRAAFVNCSALLLLGFALGLRGLRLLGASRSRLDGFSLGFALGLRGLRLLFVRHRFPSFLAFPPYSLGYKRPLTLRSAQRSRRMLPACRSAETGTRSRQPSPGCRSTSF